MTGPRSGVFCRLNRNWGSIEKGVSYTIRFELNGNGFDAVATGLYQGKVPGGIAFFDDRPLWMPSPSHKA